MNTTNKTKYALVWDGYENEGITIGTPEEITSEYLKREGFKVKAEKMQVDTDYDGNGIYELHYFYRWKHWDDPNEWDDLGTIEDQGSDKANLKEAYRVYFFDHLMDTDDYQIYELNTPERKKAFMAPIDALLERITFKEARDNGLDPDDDEPGVRAWYYENKATKAA